MSTKRARDELADAPAVPAVVASAVAVDAAAATPADAPAAAASAASDASAASTSAASTSADAGGGAPPEASAYDVAMLRLLVDARSRVAHEQRAVNGCIVALAVHPPSREVVSWGYVRSLLHQNRPSGMARGWRAATDLHAEADCISAAARGGASLLGCTLYVSSIPCEACFKLSVAAGVARIVHPPPPNPDFYAKSQRHCKRLAQRHGVAVAAGAELPPHRDCADADLGLPPKENLGIVW